MVHLPVSFTPTVTITPAVNLSGAKVFNIDNFARPGDVPSGNLSGDGHSPPGGKRAGPEGDLTDDAGSTLTLRGCSAAVKVLPRQ